MELSTTFVNMRHDVDIEFNFNDVEDQYHGSKLTTVFSQFVPADPILPNKT